MCALGGGRLTRPGEAAGGRRSILGSTSWVVCCGVVIEEVELSARVYVSLGLAPDPSQWVRMRRQVVVAIGRPMTYL